MDLSAITLTQLRYVVTVADTGHLGRAASECHVSQLTLSTQIKNGCSLARATGLAPQLVGHLG
jgi:hypothetical protein